MPSLSPICSTTPSGSYSRVRRSEEHTSELQSRQYLVCRLLLEKNHVYGEQWIKVMKDGVNATPLPTVNTTGYIDHAAFLGTINPDTNKIPKHLFQCYLNIYNNYFKAPWMPNRTEANPNELNHDDVFYGFRCPPGNNIFPPPPPPQT